MQTINPATEEPVYEFSPSGMEDIRQAAVNARRAFAEWRELSVGERCQYAKSLAKVMKRRKTELAESVTTEMGKPLREAVAEVEKCVQIAEYFSENPQFLEKEILDEKACVEFDPLGIVGAIMPWNFPMSQIIRCAVPALVAGNAVLFKPSSVVAGTGMKTQELFDDVYPENVFTTLLGSGETANHIIDMSDAVAFTGSVSTGAAIAERAGSQIKKAVLELGGSDPFIVLEDADVQKAAEGACKGRFLNCGQCCTSPKRFLVMKDAYDDFVREMKDIVSSYSIGSGMDDHDMGPLSSRQQRDTIEQQVKRSSGKIILGGKRHGSKGFFYEPTISEAGDDDVLMKEETFGPVAAVMSVDSIEQAVGIANKSDFGLAGSVWTRDIGKARAMASRLEVGMVGINMRFSSEPRLPFGGVKKSGIGRELSHYGLKEFVNIKSVMVGE